MAIIGLPIPTPHRAKHLHTSAYDSADALHERAGDDIVPVADAEPLDKPIRWLEQRRRNALAGAGRTDEVLNP